MISFINITHSRGILEDCTFQYNTFIRLQSSAVLTISNSKFHSFDHAVRSAIALNNSTVELTGHVCFSNNTVGNVQYSNVCGAVFVLNSGYDFYAHAPLSVFNIMSLARVDFINNKAASCGGAIYLKSATMNINMNATVVFIDNAVISRYHQLRGGALYIEQTQMLVVQAEVNFSNNFILGTGYGGALFQIGSNVNISDHTKIRYVNNTARPQGGAIYQSSSSHISIDKHSELVFSNNSADQGGAVYLQPPGSIEIGKSSYLEFRNNTSKKYGGAIYVNDQACLFGFTANSMSSKVFFINNYAWEGVGMHIYGASVASTNCMHSDCHNIVSYEPNMTNSLSPVSSFSKRVCLCDAKGKPQCAKFSSIFLGKRKVYRGESFNLSVVVVGYDFGVTHGMVNAGPVRSNFKSSNSKLHPEQYHQWTGTSGRCSNVTYNFYSSNETQETLYLHSLDLYYTYGDEEYIKRLIKSYNDWKHKCADIDLITTPVYVNITLLEGCPPGFTLALQDQLYGCYCYEVLQTNHFDCYIANNAGHLKWNNTMWVNATFNESESDGILLSHYCPLDYCKQGEKYLDLDRDPDAQCANNHAGVLCGGCRKNHSLAIGSFRCVKCTNDSSQLLLVLVFFVAGFLLVIFILLLNLTVTQGLINGLIFYANTLWIYNDILFSSKQQTISNVLWAYISWFNLDFGIEIDNCLVVGLTAFWKTWLQFLFPLYIWLIAGAIIIVCRYSSRLTYLIGDRAVPLLATLFLLSYTKLLRTVMTIFEYGELTHFPDKYKIIVWYLDGNLLYCKHPHIILFVVATITLIFCLPFTLFLLLIQCWKRVSHLRLLRWINKFTPFYDAYFATLRNKHRYWFGLLLLVRVALQIVFTATSSTRPFLGLLILLITLAILFLFMSLKHIHKFKLIRFLESISLLNLLVLVGCTLYNKIIGGNKASTPALQLSIGLSFVQFLAIILSSMLKICCSKYWHKYIMQRRNYNLLDDGASSEESDSMLNYEHANDLHATSSAMYRVTNRADTY